MSCTLFPATLVTNPQSGLMCGNTAKIKKKQRLNPPFWNPCAFWEDYNPTFKNNAMKPSRSFTKDSDINLRIDSRMTLEFSLPFLKTKCQIWDFCCCHVFIVISAVDWFSLKEDVERRLPLLFLKSPMTDVGAEIKMSITLVSASISMLRESIHHLESRWRNSHALVYHGPFLNPPFGGWATDLHHGVFFWTDFFVRPFRDGCNSYSIH